MPSQMESRCRVMCGFKVVISNSMMSMSSTRMPNSYPVARIALDINIASDVNKQCNNFKDVSKLVAH